MQQTGDYAAMIVILGAIHLFLGFEIAVTAGLSCLCAEAIAIGRKNRDA